MAGGRGPVLDPGRGAVAVHRRYVQQRVPPTDAARTYADVDLNEPWSPMPDPASALVAPMSGRQHVSI